jgi:Uma2 family endonuclease
VSCRPYQRGEQLVSDPVLVVEVLSPGTERYDRRTKVPAYCEIASLNEILLIDSEAAYAEILRREGDRWTVELLHGRDAILYLASVELRVSMAELYEGIDIEVDRAS